MSSFIFVQKDRVFSHAFSAITDTCEEILELKIFQAICLFQKQDVEEQKISDFNPNYIFLIQITYFDLLNISINSVYKQS